LAVKLSALIPDLLEEAAIKSTTFLPRTSEGSSSSSSGEPCGSSGDGSGSGKSSKKAGNKRVTAAAGATINLVTWEDNARRTYLVVGALGMTSRLPHQKVLERFATPAAGERVGFRKQDSCVASVWVHTFACMTATMYTREADDLSYLLLDVH
jgi:hypothetical protein